MICSQHPDVGAIACQMQLVIPKEGMFVMEGYNVEFGHANRQPGMTLSDSDTHVSMHSPDTKLDSLIHRWWTI